MDAIKAARALGKAIQEDERYINMQLASQRNEADTALQEMITKFNEGRKELAAEMQKPEKDKAKIEAMNVDLGDSYREIFRNENMVSFTQTQGEMTKLLSFINQIVNGSAQGQDPDKIEYEESCGGSCNTCGGCS
ncbi:MAG: YlbF family regulator [Oscillospiraceae bacterium]|nr:YlbF family regulator [Oscillospiraceae bacterium]